MKFAIFLQHYFPYGGLQRDSVRLAEAAIEAGDEPTLVVSTWNGPRPSNLTIREIGSGGTSNHRKAARFAKDCQKLMSQEDFDTAICFSRIPGAPFHFCGDPCLLEKFLRTKPALARHLPRYRYLIKNEEALFGKQSSSHIFYLAASEIPAYQKHYPLAPERFTLLPPWLKKPQDALTNREKNKHQLCSELGIDPSGEILLCVGSDFHRKGVDRAIDALGQLSQPGNDQAQSNPLHLVICGQDKAYSFQQQAERLGLASQVHFMGPRDDIPVWMSAASILLHPARQETAGMVLLEALTYGLPVLCTKPCGYATHVAETGCPLLDKDCPTDMLAQQITYVLGEQPRLRSQCLEWASGPSRYHTAELMLDTMRQSVRPS